MTNKEEKTSIQKEIILSSITLSRSKELQNWSLPMCLSLCSCIIQTLYGDAYVIA